ncbi:MAG: NrfD/PsrC family molybdoenzyme membrane anchor subunit [Candidatus Korobacteraceae bacterium]|jgi:Ni/Fe-hydrogenase subunit HybB-like protein
MDRVRKLKLALWTMLGLAASVAVTRFLFGLGASTNLTDANPWGVWVGFDVMSGVALASGGFIVTATVYIFKLERFHSITRPAVLTAFLGYAAVAVGLLFDLGLPWNIWHMMVYWNLHSPLFEVGWCVMLYLTVLMLEFFPVPAEEFPRLASIRTTLLKFRLPLVILGIGLSTLHQSSLGSLFLIMPYRLHPLWYSPILPVMFLISAIGLGLSMVIFESHFTAYFYHRKPEINLLASLGSACRWVLVIYLAVRIGDLIVRRQASLLLISNWRTALFWFEILVMACIPIALFSFSRIRHSRAGQWTAATFVVCGIVLNRIDIGGVAHLRPDGAFYLPSWTELAISVGVVSAAVLAFLFIVEHFKVWEERPADPNANPLKLPEFHPVGLTWLGIPGIAARTTYSLAFILATALGFGFLNVQAVESQGIDPAPVHRARGGEILWIDGNHDNFGVAFKHAEHEKREGGKESCVKCHHMNFPRDENTACTRCHRDMYLPVDAFRHDWHASPSGARVACYQCHPEGQARTAATAAHCDRCHKDLVPNGALITVKQHRAVAYTEAMHRLCIGCHVKKAQEKSKPEMTRCDWCHKDRRELIDSREVVLHRAGLMGQNVVLPAPEARK